MEKLIMLLDIYEEQVVWVHSVWDKITEKEAAWICSKKFGFIKRLIKNDKIDYGNIRLLQSKMLDIKTDNLLMLLSISDTPIDDLILYLK